MKSGWFVGWCCLAVLGLLSCGPVTEEEPGEEQSLAPVIRGVRDRGRHPSVVALLTDDDALCSGALVAPTVVLTARHCVSHTLARVDCESPSRQVFGDLAPASVRVVVGDDARTGATVARGRAIRTPTEDTLCGADLALVVLDRALTWLVPLEVELRRAPPSAVDVVGFGRRGDSSRAGVGERFFRSGVAVWSRAAREFVVGPSTCEGDSGSPALDPATGRVVGVLSRGGERCTGPDAWNVYTRTDAHAALLRLALRGASGGP